MLQKLRRDEKGFTLIELMVVVLIIAILVAIAIPTFIGMRNRGYDAQAKSNLRNGVTAAQTYFTDNEAYTGMDAAALTAIEGALTFADAGVVANTVVISGVSADDFTLTVTSTSGTAFTGIVTDNGPVVYNF